MSYAITRALGSAGAPTLVLRGNWTRATSPALEQVLIVLRTQLGSCPVMPSLGVDWTRIDKLRTSAQADAETAIRAGLDALVRAGTIRDLKVTVRVSAARGLLTYEVGFVDVLLTTRTTTGPLTRGA
jgi:hypothetical protein